MRPPPGAPTPAARLIATSPSPPSRIGPPPEPTRRATSGTHATSNALPPTAPRFQPAPSRTSTAAIARMPPWSTRPPRIPIRRAGRSRSSRPRTGPPGRRATPRRARARTCPRRAGRRRCRRATPPRPRPTPTPRHPRDQPRISRTSRQDDGALRQPDPPPHPEVPECPFRSCQRIRSKVRCRFLVRGVRTVREL